MPHSEEIETNVHGGKQSRLAYRMDLLPPAAVLAVAEVLKQGADKYDPNNWRKISVEEHLNHALVHQMNYLQTQDYDELSHAACRVMMALEIHTEGMDLPEQVADRPPQQGGESAV